MDLGYFTMPLHPPGSNITETLDADLEQLVTLDQLGYAEAWIGEHFTSVWENIPAPDLFIAKALGMTKNIILGTGVTCMPNHNPFMIAHRIALLDQLAHGRFRWGVGSGGYVGDFKVFGFDPETGEHRSMARDAVEVVLKMWDNPEPGTYKHKHWEFTIPEPDEAIGMGLHMRPYQMPHPPIAVAGVSPRSETLRLAGERGWIPMSINLVPSEQVKTHWEAVEEGAQRAGRTADRSLWRIAREIYVADTTEQARDDMLNGVVRRDFDEYVIPLLNAMGVLGLMKLDPNMPDSEVTVEYLMDNVWIVGGPDDVERQIRELYDEVGGFGVLLAMGHEWQPKDKWVNSMTVLAKEILPRLSDLD